MIVKTGKIWGETSKLVPWGFHEVHYLSIKKGGFCSEHLHRGRTSFFFVISGRLKISLWSEGQKEMEDQTILGPGDSTIIPLLVFHKFEALEDTLAIETYELKGTNEDIERRTQGGRIDKVIENLPDIKFNREDTE